MEKHIFMYAHGGSANHGCEAIVRSTVKVLNSTGYRLLSRDPSQDEKYGIDAACDLITEPVELLRGSSIRFLGAYIMLKVFHKYEPLDKINAERMLASVDEHEIAFSIGGDNYCYSSADMIMHQHMFLKKRGAKTVLWGCSVEPEVIDEKMRRDLSQYDLITARETITYKTLKGINPNTVLAPDPAFTLERQPGVRPEGLGRKPYIGINISPLIQRLEKSENITMENYQELLRYILETTDREVALIPHVIWTKNDDRIPLQRLYEEFKSTGRVYMVEDQNCMQLKDIISECEFFIGARTHATIAAYSTCVPTLVVGYSVKARGIARDLFGSEEGYVLPVQELKEKKDLVNAFANLYGRKDEIGEHLRTMMPEYIRGVDLAREAVEKL